MPTTLDEWANPDIWLTRTEFCKLHGVHHNTLSKAKENGKIDEKFILQEFGNKGTWWVRKDCPWRPRPHGRPASPTNDHLRRRFNYLKYIPECPDLRTIPEKKRMKWYALIDMLCELGPEEFLEYRRRKEGLPPSRSAEEIDQG